MREELDNMEEKREILLTQEGYDNLEGELEYLKTEKRTEIAERIKGMMRLRVLKQLMKIK